MNNCGDFVAALELILDHIEGMTCIEPSPGQDAHTCKLQMHIARDELDFLLATCRENCESGEMKITPAMKRLFFVITWRLGIAGVYGPSRPD